MRNAALQPLRISARTPLKGRIAVPGDKSISHRAIMLAGLAIGESRIEGLLESEDISATIGAMRQLGATIEQAGHGRWNVHGVGVGGLLQPANALDMGNSGTSARLLMGLAASSAVTVTLIGDASLSRRPMERVAEPLARMGADIALAPGGSMPLTVRGIVPAVPIAYTLPLASAQVKSAVLLAALNTPGITRIVEPVRTRDHTERMLAAFGAEITIADTADSRVITVRGEAALRARSVTVPGDLSSAAFWLVGATIVPGSDVVIENVGINATRDGLIGILRLMGADIRAENARSTSGEPVADLRVRHAALTGVDIPPELVATMIDEFPALFVAAAAAHGTTTVRGAGELRIKESDRIAAMATALNAIGGCVAETADGAVIDGLGGDLFPGNAQVASKLDHRVAMALAVAGLAARAAVTIDDMTPVATSYPAFIATMKILSGKQIR